MGRFQTTRVIPWEDKYLEFFDLFGVGWQAPGELKTVVNGRRTRMTVEGVFRNTHDAEVKLVCRLSKDASGVWWVTEERLEQHFQDQVRGAPE